MLCRYSCRIGGEYSEVSHCTQVVYFLTPLRACGLGFGSAPSVVIQDYCGN